MWTKHPPLPPRPGVSLRTLTGSFQWINQMPRIHFITLDDQGTFHKGEKCLFNDCRLQSMRFYHNEMPAYIIYCKFFNVEFLMLNIFYILQILEGVYISLYRNWYQKCNFLKYKTKILFKWICCRLLLEYYFFKGVQTFLLPCCNNEVKAGLGICVPPNEWMRLTSLSTLAPESLAQ